MVARDDVATGVDVTVRLPDRDQAFALVQNDLLQQTVP